MCLFYSTSTFRKSLKDLLSKRKNGYSSIVNDICNEFLGKTIQQILSNRDQIVIEDSFSVIKLRLPNSGLSRSKRDGFRLIYLARKDRNEVIFLYVFPKTGPMKIDNIGPQTLHDLLVEYASDYMSLIQHDINDNLNIIEQDTTTSTVGNNIAIINNDLKTDS